MSSRSLNDDLRVTIGIVASQTSLTLVFYYRFQKVVLNAGKPVSTWAGKAYSSVHIFNVLL
jgi:hypothetical protein